MIIKTEKLIIRDYTEDDLPVVHKLVQTPEVYRYQSWGPNSEKDTKNFITMAIKQQSEKPRTSFELAITDIVTGDIIGAVGIRVKSQQARIGDIGYWLTPPLWGQGITTEAASALIKFGFEELNLNKIWAIVFSENPASKRVLEKIGMIEEGYFRQHIFARDRYWDCYFMAVFQNGSKENGK